MPLQPGRARRFSTVLAPPEDDVGSAADIDPVADEQTADALNIITSGVHVPPRLQMHLGLGQCC